MCLMVDAAIVSDTGYCPEGYVPITNEHSCEYFGIVVLGLPDEDGEAYVFNSDGAAARSYHISSGAAASVDPIPRGQVPVARKNQKKNY